MTTQAPQQQAAPPGSLYGVPGLTLLTEQYDNNVGIVAPIGQAASSQVQGMVEFKQTDVVYWWEMEVAFTNTVTLAGGTLATSPYFPWNIFGESRLQIQNMYSTWHVLSGIDAYIFQLYRPMRSSDKRNVQDVNAENASSIYSQVNQTAGANQAPLNGVPNITSATTGIVFEFDIPASLFFDVYYDLAVDGTVISQPHRALVSPQYMAGAARVVQPQLGVAAAYGNALDINPFTIASGAPTYAGNLALSFRRVGVYSANNPAPLPVVYRWQYLRDCSMFSLAGVARKDLVVPTYGQILSMFVRMWDPSAAAGKGAPIALSAVTKCQVQFGSGLLRFDDIPKAAQRRFIRQHGVLPPEGVLVWDMGMDEFGRMTNANALNTLTTAGVLVHLEFTSALSATAYAVLGVEALTYVA